MEIGTEIIKLNWKIKVVLSILIGLLFVGIMSLIHYWIDGNFQSLNSYLFQGIFFGLFMGIGFPYVTQKFGSKITSKLGKNITPELTPDEQVEIEGPANLFCGIEGVGGKLFLTNKKVIFKSHNINIQKGQTNINYENITELIKRKTLKLIDNGIRIKTNEGKYFDFVVNERDKWVAKLIIKIK
jgi:hypothetical protein